MIPQPPVILFQAPNGIGLGHINRMAAIALAVRAREPAALVPFVLQGGSHSMLEAAKLPYASLPDGPMLIKRGTYSPWGAAVVFEASRQIIHGIGPELIVCDTIPCPPFMTAGAEMKVPIALCARKTKDDRAYFESLQRFESMLELLIIPHADGEVDLPPHLQSRARFVGNIVRQLRASQRDRSTSRAKQIVITGGGGGAAGTVEFYNLAMAAFARCRRKDPDLACALVAGPLFEQWWQLRLAEDARVVPFEPQLRDLMAEADLVICQAGYNTVSEITQLAVPCICVPALRGYDDQIARALDVAKAVPHFRIYQESDPESLADLIETCLAAPRPGCESLPISDGADRAAAVLLEHVANRRRSGAVGAAVQPAPRSARSVARPAAPPGAASSAVPAGRPGRNDPCPCGSGRKYKACHGRRA